MVLQFRCSSSWMGGEVMDAIDIWSEIKIEPAFLSNHQNKAAYKWTVKEMVTWGHNCDWAQCQSKGKILRQQFARTWDSNSMSGS